MKILLAQSSNYFNWTAGGVKANRILLEGLAARGHECVFLGMTPSSKQLGAGVAPPDPGAPAGSRHNGVRVYSAANSYQQSVMVLSLAEEFGPDLVLVSEEGYLLLQAALEACPRGAVAMAHSTADLPFGPAAVMKDELKAGLWERAAGVIAVSNYVRDYLREWGGLGATTLYFPSYGAGPFPFLGNFGGEYVTLINPCSLKGVDIFLGLARQFPEVGFAAVPTWGTSDKDRAALAQLPNVSLLQPSANIDDIFARTRVLLAPSLCYEALGQVVIEAMARGVPALASDLGGLREAKLGVPFVLPVNPISHEGVGIGAVAPPQDTGAWADALRGLLTDRALYERLSADSREAALGFISAAGIEPFERFLAGLAAAGGPGRAAPRQGGRSTAAPRGAGVDALLNTLSPERRALLALKLKKGRRGVAERTTTPSGGGSAPPAPGPRARAGHEALVEMQPGDSGPPFFCVHPVGGGVFCYTELARQLGPGQAFYGLQARGLDGARPPLTNLGEMAAHYVEAVRGVRPEGPYLLGGWSMGGVVAFEMARLLRARGDHVAYLALIDSKASGEPAAAKSDAELLFDIAEQMGAAGEQLQPLRERLDARRPADVLDAFCEGARSLGLLPAALGPAQARALLDVYKANHRALLGYAPGRYDGTLTLFEAAGTAADPRFDAALGWGPFVSGGVERREVPGSHFSIMREPHVGELARLLRAGIAANRSALQHTQC